MSEELNEEQLENVSGGAAEDEIDTQQEQEDHHRHEEEQRRLEEERMGGGDGTNFNISGGGDPREGSDDVTQL